MFAFEDAQKSDWSEALKTCRETLLPVWEEAAREHLEYLGEPVDLLDKHADSELDEEESEDAAAVLSCEATRAELIEGHIELSEEKGEAFGALAVWPRLYLLWLKGKMHGSKKEAPAAPNAEEVERYVSTRSDDLGAEALKAVRTLALEGPVKFRYAYSDIEGEFK